MDLDAARLTSATDALRGLLSFTRPADAALRAHFRDNPQLGQRDRAVVADLSFAVLRNLRLLEALTGGREPRRLLLAAALEKARPGEKILLLSFGQGIDALGDAPLRLRQAGHRSGCARWLYASQRLCS